MKSVKAKKIKAKLFPDLRGYADVDPCIYMKAECMFATVA